MTTKARTHLSMNWLRCDGVSGGRSSRQCDDAPPLVAEVDDATVPDDPRGIVCQHLSQALAQHSNDSAFVCTSHTPPEISAFFCVSSFLTHIHTVGGRHDRYRDPLGSIGTNPRPDALSCSLPTPHVHATIVRDALVSTGRRGRSSRCVAPRVCHASKPRRRLVARVSPTRRASACSAHVRVSRVHLRTHRQCETARGFGNGHVRKRHIQEEPPARNQRPGGVMMEEVPCVHEATFWERVFGRRRVVPLRVNRDTFVWNPRGRRMNRNVRKPSACGGDTAHAARNTRCLH